jgi:hypothetical protein
MVFRSVGRRTFRRVVWVALLVMALAACSDGDGSKSAGPPSDNTNWDTLVWDQHQWQ